jgi:hypothetical protein
MLVVRTFRYQTTMNILRTLGDNLPLQRGRDHNVILQLPKRTGVYGMHNRGARDFSLLLLPCSEGVNINARFAIFLGKGYFDKRVEHILSAAPQLQGQVCDILKS